MEKKEHRRWTGYLYEFFMLFLAVTAGFYVENLREDLSEKRMERQYVRSLLEDLQRDTARFNLMRPHFQSLVMQFDSSRSYLIPPIASADERHAVEYIAKSTGIYTFIYNDVTIQQLKSTGNLRLLKQNVVDSLLAYDLRMHSAFMPNYKNIWERRIELLEKQTHIIDFSVFQPIVFNVASPKKQSGSLLLTHDVRTLKEYYNTHQLYIQYIIDFNVWIDKMSSQSERLITFIRQEYHLQ